MRVVRGSRRAACAALFALVCGCASGAPEGLERQEHAIPAFVDADAGVEEVGKGPTNPPGAVPSARDAAAAEDVSSSDRDSEEDPVEGGAGEGSAGAAAGAAGMAAAGAGAQPAGGATQPGADTSCFEATLLWSDGFESGDYRNWSSQTYGADWGDDCQDNAISSDTASSGTRSQRSEITCAYAADTTHRGYGALQFDGDELAPALTNDGVGTDAPDGLVNTTWIRLDSDTVFADGKWISLLTVRADCSFTDTSDQLLGIGIEDTSGRLAAAHYQFGEGGTRTYTANAPALPRHQWVRMTTYLNYHTGEMHVWQDGQSVQHVTFSRPLQTVCSWRWGLHASANNDAIVLFEDDNAIWKLEEPWTDFTTEPYFGHAVTVCN
jgi:hypothetical protein